MHSITRMNAFFGAFHAFLAVGLGAFGAHLLRASLSTAALETWRTAAHYHLMHAIALLAITALLPHLPDTRRPRAALVLLHGGIWLFCGSLYTLSLSGIKSLGMITPFGGLCFLAGWLMLAIGVIGKK